MYVALQSSGSQRAKNWSGIVTNSDPHVGPLRNISYIEAEFFAVFSSLCAYFPTTGKRKQIPVHEKIYFKQCEESESTVFDLYRYFAGETTAWGIFEDRFGALRRAFTVKIEGVIEQDTEQDTLVLHEDFDYADGATETRVWKIKALGAGRYSGTAGDVVGQAEGQIDGHQLTWQYQMELPIGGRNVRVRFDDRMYLLDDGILVNRATVTKWGITLGTVSIFFKKPD